jgi:hypothetical protein
LGIKFGLGNMDQDVPIRLTQTPTTSSIYSL